MDVPTEIPPGFFDSMVSSIPYEFRALILIGIGLFAIAAAIKLIGATIRAAIGLVVFGGLAALFVVITQAQGWIDWPFYDGHSVTVPDLPDREDLPDLNDLPLPTN